VSFTNGHVLNVRVTYHARLPTSNPSGGQYAINSLKKKEVHMSRSIKTMAVKGGIGLALCVAMAPASNALAAGGNSGAKLSPPPLPGGHALTAKHHHTRKHHRTSDRKVHYRADIIICNVTANGGCLDPGPQWEYVTEPRGCTAWWRAANGQYYYYCAFAYFRSGAEYAFTAYEYWRWTGYNAQYVGRYICSPTCTWYNN
jgi:hypothetical protein